jgi:hypothetical protein
MTAVADSWKMSLAHQAAIMWLTTISVALDSTWRMRTRVRGQNLPRLTTRRVRDSIVDLALAKECRFKC